MPQQRRAQATRRAIVIAAAEEFDRADYDATPLSAILRRSGVTKGAFYFHFPSKEALALALIRLQAQSWSRLWRHWMRRGLDPLSTAVGMTGEATRMLESDVLTRAGTRLAGQQVGTAAERHAPPDWEKLLAELLTRSADNGLLRAGVDPGAVARVMHAALVGVRAIGFEYRNGPGMAARITEIWRVVLEGIASAEWLSNNDRSRP
jgi:AcrR family transcriptional regulator